MCICLYVYVYTHTIKINHDISIQFKSYKKKYIERIKERIQTENNECSRNNKSKSFGKVNYLLIYSVKKGGCKYENQGTIGEFIEKKKTGIIIKTILLNLIVYFAN